MSKEYQFYKKAILVYIIIIANGGVLLSEGFYYYIWFLSSIITLSILLIYEREKLLDLIKHPTEYKFSRESIYLLVFVFTYPRHYQFYRNLDYGFVAPLQLINVLLFIIVFCVKKRTSEM